MSIFWHRVVDYGGLFHDDVKPGHKFRDGDHRLRTVRATGLSMGSRSLKKCVDCGEAWLVHAAARLFVEKLGNTAVKSVVPTMIQEHGEGARTIESKLDGVCRFAGAVPVH